LTRVNPVAAIQHDAAGLVIAADDYDESNSVAAAWDDDGDA